MLNLPMSNGFGWYTNLTNREYHASEGVSSTTLKKFLTQTPASILYEREHPQPATDEMNLGSAVHTLVLERDRFALDFAVRPVLNLRTKAGRAARDQFIEENKTKIILDADQVAVAYDMADAILKHPVARSLLADIIAENSIYWRHNSGDETVLLKCRPDALTQHIPLILDVKTTRNASWSFMQKEIARRQYHLSAAMYLEGCNNCRELVHYLQTEKLVGFCLICVENTPPYQVACYELSPQYIDSGRELFRVAVDRYIECTLTGWEGYPPVLRVIEPPGWESFIHPI